MLFVDSSDAVPVLILIALIGLSAYFAVEVGHCAADSQQDPYP